MSTVTPQSDSNLDVTVTESANLVCLDINPASFTGGGGSTGTVTTVATGLGLTGGPITTDGTIAIDTTSDITFNSMTADMYGVQHFIAKAREAISAGQPVYISGHSGNTPEVMVADYADPAKMPAFGIASADIANNNNGDISTAGDLKNIDTTGTSSGETWAVGDVLYVDGSNLTNVRPSSETQAIQSLAKVIRVHANVGQMFLSGAGRVNDIPNLDSLHVFIGDTVAPERRQLTYTDILNTPTIPTDQTLSFADPVLTISGSLSTVDLSSLTPDLTNLIDVASIAPDSGGMTITDAGQTTVQWGSSAKLQWRSGSDGAEVDQWVFDSTGNDIFTGMQWRTSSNRKIFRFDAINAGGTDPGDGSHSTNFQISGVNNTFKSRQHNESPTGLTFDADTINLQSDNGVSVNGSYTLPMDDGTANQVLTTDGAGNISFATGGGGGGSLGSLSDVTITSVQNNDLLMYNSTASEWQNTNLGVSVTPTLTGASAAAVGTEYTLTVDNHASYDDPAYFVEVYDGFTVIVNNWNVTDNLDGTLTFTIPNTVATYQIRVRCQDFGDLQSEIATQDFDGEAFGGTFRYWRVANFLGTPINMGIKNIRFYGGATQTGTAYPTNMTSAVLPTPFVADASYYYAGSGDTYAPFKAYDSSAGTFVWFLGKTGGVEFDWVEVDLGSSTAIASLSVGEWYGNQPSQFQVLASNTGAFTGEETLIATVTTTGGLSDINNIYNLG